MIELGRQSSDIRVVSDQIGSPTYAADLARAIACILKSPQWVQGIYHFANEGVCSWYDFARVTLWLAGIKDCHITPIPTEDWPTAAARPSFSVLDKSRIRLTYGVKTPNWIDSLQDCINRLK